MIEFRQISIGKWHIVNEKFVSDYAISIDSFLEGSLNASSILSGIFSIKTDVDSLQFFNFFVLFPKDRKLFSVGLVAQDLNGLILISIFS